MKINKGFGIPTVLFLMMIGAIAILVIPKKYFPEWFKGKKPVQSQYQLVDNIDNSKYMQCIDGAKYIVATSFFGSDSVAKLTNSSGQSESCEVKIYNSDQMSSMMKSNSNSKLKFIMVH